MTTPKHGGARPGAGRPPTDDPTVTVSIQVRKSRAEKLPLEKIKQVSLLAIEKEYKKAKGADRPG